MQPQTKARAYTEGWQGRRRNYKCRACGVKFQVDALNPLPEKERICPFCREHTTPFPFIDEITGKECEVRAGDAELATLRAWLINPNLTFKRVTTTIAESYGDLECVCGKIIYKESK